MHIIESGEKVLSYFEEGLSPFTRGKLLFKCEGVGQDGRTEVHGES